MNYYECHGHILLGQNSIADKFKLLSENGVVFFREAGAKEALYDSVFPELHSIAEKVSRIKNLAQENGIEYKTPVFAFYKEGLYGKFLGKSFYSCKDLCKQITETRKSGAEFIKVMYSGIASFKNPGKLSCEPLTKDEIKEIVSICHGEGLKVMAHCNGADTIKYAIDYETDSIEHGIFIDETGLKMLADSKTIWVPTITAITNEKLQQNHLESLKYAAFLGVKVTTGTDFGANSNANSLQQNELDFLINCGFSLEKIENGAKHLLS